MIPSKRARRLVAHASAEAPNECCGLIVFSGETAERYIPGRNKLASPYRYELDVYRPCASTLLRPSI